ncbi:MAG: virulence RhuM family protein [Victivallales bacterium]|nr:virulence RhuM family protein [Victivallales bacterium]
MEEHGEIIIYQTEDGLARLNVSLRGDTVWLSLDQMSALFERDKSTISRHIRNVFAEGELSEVATVANFATVQMEGDREVSRDIAYYNLDVIISVGYRVKSQRGVQFRIWATKVLKEYMIKGFALDDERLKGHGGGNYWIELLDRIRDIRSSEKVLYRQVLDLYATSVDYDPKSAESIQFFKIVQNKLHYAAHGHTAAEVIFERADANKEFMGLRNFAGAFPVMRDVEIAKNYLDENELKVLNNLVSGYFDFAEISAIEHRPMYMADYIRQLDAILSSGGRKLLEGSGQVSHDAAIEKAHREYRKYQQKTITPVEEAYLASLKTTEKVVKAQTKPRSKKS